MTKVEKILSFDSLLFDWLHILLCLWSHFNEKKGSFNQLKNCPHPQIYPDWLMKGILMTTFMIFEFDEKYGPDHLIIIIGCVALISKSNYRKCKN